jgi:uncharacterized protein YjbJ (UPF0337 family)
MLHPGRIYPLPDGKRKCHRGRPRRVYPEPETRRKQMKSSTTDQVKGDLHQAKGKVKEKVGKVVGNPDLEAEGKNENLAGKVQKKVGQIEKVIEK